MEKMSDDDLHFDHEISVTNLRFLLSKLEDGDILVPNRVRNLTVYRHDLYVGFINLSSGRQCIEFYDEDVANVELPDQ